MVVLKTYSPDLNYTYSLVAALAESNSAIRDDSEATLPPLLTESSTLTQSSAHSNEVKDYTKSNSTLLPTQGSSNPKETFVLLLDCWPETPVAWVPTRVLYRAMNTPDRGNQGKFRGFLKRI